MNHISPQTPSSFIAIEDSVERIASKLPACSRDDVVLTRLIKCLAKGYGELLNDVIRPLGLNHVMFITLMAAFGSADNEVNPSELSDASGESRANMTRICDELCERGLIHRHASEADRRRVVVSLTANGEALVRRMLPELRIRQQPLIDALDRAEKRQLETMLKKLLSVMDTIL